MSDLVYGRVLFAMDNFCLYFHSKNIGMIPVNIPFGNRTWGFFFFFLGVIFLLFLFCCCFFLEERRRKEKEKMEGLTEQQQEFLMSEQGFRRQLESIADVYSRFLSFFFFPLLHFFFSSSFLLSPS